MLWAQSETESSAESGPLNVIVDMLLGHGLLNNFFHWEGSVSGGVEIGGSGMKGSLLSAPLLDFSQLS